MAVGCYYISITATDQHVLVELLSVPVEQASLTSLIHASTISHAGINIAPAF